VVFCLAVSSRGHGGLFNEDHAHQSGTLGNPVLPGSYVVIIWRNLSDPRLHILWLLRDGGSARPGFLFFHQSVVACGDHCEAITIEPPSYRGCQKHRDHLNISLGVFQPHQSHAAENCRVSPPWRDLERAPECLCAARPKYVCTILVVEDPSPRENHVHAKLNNQEHVL
jgi:hypothetical protein